MKRRMNKLESLAYEKFNGDLKAAWDYVLYEVAPEERGEYMRYVSKEQLDIGMTAIRRTSHNEIDELAANKFNGDLKVTWDYIFSNCSQEEVKRYTSMADAHQVAAAVLLVDGLKDKIPRREKRLWDRTIRILEKLRITCDELKNMQNPYRISLLKNGLSQVLLLAAIAGLLVYKNSLGMDERVFKAGMSILGIANSNCAICLPNKLWDYFSFRSAQKEMKKDGEFARGIREYWKYIQGKEQNRETKDTPNG